MITSRHLNTSLLTFSLLLGAFACDSSTDDTADNDTSERPSSKEHDAGGHDAGGHDEAAHDSGMQDNGGGVDSDSGTPAASPAPPATGDAGQGDAGAAGAGSVTDCASMCETAELLACPVGSLAGCNASCPFLSGLCAAEMTAYFECSKGKEYTSDNSTCDEQGGIILHHECQEEAAGINACSSSLL